MEILPSLKLTSHLNHWGWKMLVSFWEGQFSQAMLVSRRVHAFQSHVQSNVNYYFDISHAYAPKMIFQVQPLAVTVTYRDIDKNQLKADSFENLQVKGNPPALSRMSTYETSQKKRSDSFPLNLGCLIGIPTSWDNYKETP